jgi:ribosomal protein S9
MANYNAQNGEVVTPGTQFYSYSDIALYNNSYTKVLEIPTRLIQKTDIKVVAISGQAGAIATSALRGWLEDN